MSMSNSDVILLVISLAGLSLIAIALYLLLPKSPPTPPPAPDGENDDAPNNRAQRRRAANRQAGRRRDAANNDDDDGDDGDDDDGDQNGDENDESEPRVMTKKERMKAMKKAEKEERRRYEEQRREELRQKKEAEERDYLERKEREKEEREKEKEEKERLEREKKEREEKEYEDWKGLFSLEEVGEDGGEDDEGIMMEGFVEYVSTKKIVTLDDLAVAFDMKAKAVADLLKRLETEGRIVGVMDDRGKYICVTKEEMMAIADFVSRRGRVSLAELAEETTRIICSQRLSDQDDYFKISPGNGGGEALAVSS